MTDTAVIHWLPGGLAGVAYIADNHPETDPPKYMRVKPCPWCRSHDGELLEGRGDCGQCKDGWVIA